jgi:hypothetical protein
MSIFFGDDGGRGQGWTKVYQMLKSRRRAPPRDLESNGTAGQSAGLSGRISPPINADEGGPEKTSSPGKSETGALFVCKRATTFWLRSRSS